MDDGFFNGIIGSRVSVCGQRLFDLTPWHQTLLKAIDSPVIEPGEKTDRGDVLQFLRVVNASWPDVPNLKPRIRDVFWYIKLGRKKTFARETEKLSKWMDIQLSMPKLWEVTYSERGSSRTLSSPAMLALVVALVSKLGLGLAEAWNMRISEARWYDTTLAELLGGDVKFAYENENQPAQNIKRLNEDEITAMAKAELNPREFQKWEKARRKIKK